MRKIMIVDDNSLSAQGIAENICWKELDATVTHIKYNGTSAIKAMEKASIDLIISDIKMPDLDGLTLSKLALSINPLVKIILISAYDSFDYAKSAIRLGVYDYIEKPIDYEYLNNKIKNALESLNREEKNIEIINQSRPLMVEKFFRELVQYPGKEAKLHLGHYTKYLNLNLNYPYFCAVIMEIKNATDIEHELGITVYQIELLNVLDIWKEQFKIFDSSYFYYNFNNIICILGQKTSNPNHFSQVIHKASSSLINLCKEGKLSFHIGIGQIMDSLWNLHMSYESALYALKYRFFFPQQNIFDAKEALGREFTLLSSEESKEEELIQLLCKKDMEAIECWLLNFFQTFTRECPEKNLLFIKIYSLLGRILKFLYELNIDTSDIESEITHVYNKFDTFQTYKDFSKWMNHICTLACNKLDVSQQSYHEQLCELALIYIRENFEDKDLNLNDIAHHVNVSPAYLSVLFKKTQNVSISDTIITYRINKACHYLKNSTLSLNEISAKCGYSNQYYFSNSFKNKIGISPSAYREQNAD